MLNGVYKKCQNRTKTLLKNEQVTLSFDGWSNIHKEPVVCVVATTSNGDAYLIDSVTTGSESHTAENLKFVAEQALNKGINEYEFQVVGFVTDNTGNVSKLRRTLASGESLEDVQMLGCGAHVLNLLEKDFKSKDISNKILQVCKFFRNHHQPAAWLKEKSSKVLVLPSEVRWNSMYDCLSIYLELWPVLMQIIETQRPNIPNDIYVI